MDMEDQESNFAPDKRKPTAFREQQIKPKGHRDKTTQPKSANTFANIEKQQLRI
jgi:hypothetical protein